MDIETWGETMDAQLSILVCVRGVVSGKPYWAYARIPPSRYLAFLAAQTRGGYNLAEFAQDIPAHGEGENPPEPVARQMRTQGYNPDFENDFKHLLEEAASALEKKANKPEKMGKMDEKNLGE